MEDVLFYQNYFPAGDVITLALCFVVGFLMRSTYTLKRANLNIFKRANRTVAIAAVSSLFYHMLLDSITMDNVPLIYFFRATAYSALVWTYVCFCVYICNVVELEGKKGNAFRFMIYGACIVHTILQYLGPYLKIGFYIDDALEIHQNYYLDVFRFAYVYYSVMLFAVIFIHKKKMIKKIRECIGCVMGLSFNIMVYQAFFLQTSYTTVTFVIPLIAVLFLFHYNAYDIDTGTLDQYAFDEFLEDSKDKRYSMVVLSLPGISHDKMQKLSYDFLRKNNRYFENSYCFRLRNDRIILAYQKEKNKNYNEILNLMFQDFIRINDEEKNDFRIILLDHPELFEHGTETLYFCEYLEQRMPINEIKVCTTEDIKVFQGFKKLVKELKDIYEKEDLDDPRVKVYCQPVLNLKTNTFSTAEALMRLEIPGIGMVYPDQFIPVLETQNMIHVFSKIILNKTCKEIKALKQQGYLIERVSVNFSVQELQIESFCEDVMQIIRDNEIDLDNIAIELTESKNEKDFRSMEHVMEVLHTEGMKFYLDDFGTGYSNFERIIGLPVDTIKFDRSLTILAGKDEESKFMVGSFSEIFKRANYQILFEGVEDEKDEIQCKDMNAQYLQGYKYSKPIPIEQLKDFLEKED